MDENTVLTWLSLSQRLKDLKAEEASLRRQLCSELFEGKEGEFKTQLKLGSVVVTGKSSVNRKIDQAVLNTIIDELSDEERMCIRYKPELELKSYRKLPENSLLHECITESPAMPTLDVEFLV